MATKNDYPELVQALEAGPLQPWQRDASGADRPEVGRHACIACMAAIARKEAPQLQRRKLPPHTCAT